MVSDPSFLAFHLSLRQCIPPEPICHHLLCTIITLEKDCEVETLCIFESVFVEKISPYLTEIDSKLFMSLRLFLVV